MLIISYGTGLPPFALHMVNQYKTQRYVSETSVTVRDVEASMRRLSNEAESKLVTPTLTKPLADVVTSLDVSTGSPLTQHEASLS